MYVYMHIHILVHVWQAHVGIDNLNSTCKKRTGVQHLSPPEKGRNWNKSLISFLSHSVASMLHNTRSVQVAILRTASLTLTVSLLSALTSIIPFNNAWQSGGMKWGIWNTPLFTFSRSCRRLSWSKGKAPWGKDKERFTVDDQIGTGEGWFVSLRSLTGFPLRKVNQLHINTL